VKKEEVHGKTEGHSENWTSTCNLKTRKIEMSIMLSVCSSLPARIKGCWLTSDK